MSILVQQSPTSKDNLFENNSYNDMKKKLQKSSEDTVNLAPSSPSKRVFLHQMSPNVAKSTYLHQTATKDIQTKPAVKPSKFQRPQFPSTLKPPMNIRSKTLMNFTSTSSTSASPFELRRSNSLISSESTSSSSSTDRFIPSRHNSTTGKLETTINTPSPNASPKTHIKAQTSKIYQHHVAEACGLDVNSKILLYKPLPPERKKPANLFSTNTSKLKLTNGLPPSIASARAKKIPTCPDRVLDAPGLVDDFYLNLLSWSSNNLLAIGLDNSVYVWNASTGSVGLLCELPVMVTSVRWSNDGSYISIGKEDGIIEIWDIETNTKLRNLNCNNHATRIAAQCWNQHILTSGDRLGNLYHSDVRISQQYVNMMSSHSAEICGIEYRNDGGQFASGGNDNLVCIWDVRNTTPLFNKSNHKAAVKALSWCPYQPSLLATGGGSSDKTINFWNTTTGSRVNTIETGSQISSLNWGYSNGTGLEVVATHGFPTNSISLFNYPTLQKTGEINSAHDSRILNGCISPDHCTLATVAGDENLKFWSLFDLVKNKREFGDVTDVDGEDKSEVETKRIKKMMSLR